MIEKYIQLGGVLLLFILTLAVPQVIVLTSIQLALIVVAAVLTYRHFGEDIIKFWNHLKGEDDGNAAPKDTRESRGTAGVEPTVAVAVANDAATEGQRDPS